MANDLIEIPIEVRDRGSIRRVTQQLDEFGNTANNAQRSASAFVDNFERQAKATNKAVLANQRYAKSAQDFYRAQQEANLSNKSAEKSAMAFSAAIDKSANSLRQLKATIDPTYRSQQNLLQTKRVLREAVQRGNITMDEAVNTMRRYREAQIGMTTAGVGNTRSMNAMGMATQQAGYQVGDFLVQIQGGTNAFVAFGQQATQLVGILPMMAEQFNMNVNRLIGISSVLGIVIPLATALGAAFMRTRGAAEESSDATESLSSAVRDFSSAAKDAAKDGRDLAEKYGDSADKARELFEVNKTLAELDAIDALKRSLVSLQDEFGNFSDVSVNSLERAMETFDELGDRAITGIGLTDKQLRSANDAVQVYRETVVDLENRLGSTRQEAFQFATELSKLSQADGPKAAAEQLEIVRNLYFDIIGGTEGATEAQRNLLREMVNTAIEVLNLNVEIEEGQTDRKKVSKEQSEIDEKIVDLAKEVLSTYDEIQQSYQNEKKSLEQKIALLTIEKQFGEDSLAYKRLQNQQEEENYRERLKSLGLSQEQIGNLVQMLRTQQNITTEVGASTNQAQNLTNALSAASSVAAGLLARVGGVVQGLRDQVAAVEQGTSVSIVAMERQLRDLEDTRARLDAKGMDVSNTVKQIDKIRSGIENAKKETVNLKNAQDSVASSSSSAGKAGSKAGEDIEESVRTANDVFKDAIVTAEEFELQMAEGVVSAVDSVANAWGDFVMRGFQDFKGFVDSVWSSFKSLISDMISTAAKNRIMISLGMAGSGTAAAAGTGGGVMDEAGGLSSLMGGSGFLGLGGGSGSLFGGAGLLGAGGGTGIMGLGAGSGLAGALGGGAFGAAASVALPVIGIGLALAGLMKKTEVLVAEGVRARIDGATAELDSYEKTKTNNAFGFSSGFSRDFTRLDDAVQNAVQTRLDTTIQALGAFGLGTDLGGFSFSKRTEIKEGESFEGESEEVINEALNAAIEHLSNGALDMFQKTGESLSGTLDRLTTSIQTVNPVVDVMGGNILDVSLEGASAASALVDLVGGLEAFGNKSSFVFDNFLTDAEKMEIAEDRLGTAFENINNSIEGVNVSLPETHEAFLALKNSQDLSTEAGRQLHAALLDVAPQFVEVKGTAQEVVDAAANDLIPALDDTGDAARELAAIEREREGLLRQIARATGNVEYIRQQELLALNDSTRALQEHIYTLEDQVQAAQDAKDANNELLSSLRDQASETENLISEVKSALGISGDVNPATRLQDAQQAYDDVLSALTNAIERERSRLENEISSLEGALSGAAEALGKVFKVSSDTTLADKISDATQSYDNALSDLASGIERERNRLQGEVSALESVMASAAEALGKAFDRAADLTLPEKISNATQAYETALTDLAAGIERERSKLQNEISSLEGALSGAAKALGKAFDRVADPTLAEKITVATQTYNSALSALQEGINRERSTAESRLSDLESQKNSIIGVIDDIVGKLRSAAQGIFSDNERIVELQRKQAVNQLRQMLETGDVNPDTVDTTISRATSFGDNYATRVDMMRDQGITAGLLDRIADEQQSIADEERDLQRKDSLTLSEQLEENKVHTLQAERELRRLGDLEDEFNLASTALTTGQLAENVAKSKDELEGLFSAGSVELSKLDDQLSSLGEIERELTVGELKNNVTKAKEELEDLFSAGSVELSKLDGQLEKLKSLEEDFGVVKEELTVGELAENVTKSKNALESLFGDGSVELENLRNQLIKLEETATAAGVIQQALTVGELFTNLETAKDELGVAREKAEEYHNGLISKLDEIKTEIGEIETKNEVLDDTISSGGSSGLSPSEEDLIKILSGISGASGAGILGGSALGQLSEDKSNALLSNLGVSALTDTAKDVANTFKDELGRNVDIKGLQFYVDALSDAGFGLSDLAKDLAGSTEAITGVIPGFAVPGSDTGGSGGGGSSGGASGGGTSGGGSSDPIQDAVDEIAKANGTDVFPKPDDVVGGWYGKYGVPISESGYKFWKKLYEADKANKYDFIEGARKDETFMTVPEYRLGGVASGGLSLVGEQGPELVNLPAGSYVNTASQTSRILGIGNSPAQPTSLGRSSSSRNEAELVMGINDLKNEVSALRKETVQIQASSSKFTKRSYDIYRKWDVDGLPPERT